MRSLSLAALALLVLAAAAPAARDPVDRTQARAPDGTPVCADWVHARHRIEANGRRYATWHPPRDPRYRCAFGHEHGSNPRAFRFARRMGMPAFGAIGAFAGVEEAHPGFKLFVANADGRGLAWAILLHQGSGSPRRGTTRFHSLEAWLFSRRSGRLVAHVRRMADFGEPVANCPGTAPLPRMRLLPHPDCPAVYERWDTALDVGGVMGAAPGFAIDNAATQFDPARPAATLPNKRVACGPADPAGWDSYCKGDKRSVLHPGWVVRNDGPARFRTDAQGVRAPSGLLQFVSNRVRVDQRGIDSSFVMERPSDGGLYRAGRGRHSRNFEFPGYCVLGAN